MFEKEYSFKTITDEEILKNIASLIISSKNQDNIVNVLELGTGIGAITIPVIKCISDKLKEVDDIKINWFGYDIDTNAIEYFKNKFKEILKVSFIKQTAKIRRGKNNLKIIIQIKDIERSILNNDFNLSVNLFDVIFMPSFLYHITFWKDVLIWCFNHLKKDGRIIFGYPTGVWAFPEKGYLSVSSQYINEKEKIWFDAWQNFYKMYPNYYLFFRRHYNELHDILLGKMILEEIKEVTLQEPDKNSFKNIIENKGFAFNKLNLPFDFKIDYKLFDELFNNLNLNKNIFKYTFEVFKKVTNEVQIKDTFTFNHSLNAKSIDVDFISKEPKLSNQLMIYGIIKTFLGEGILSRDSDINIIGSFVSYHLNYFIKGSDKNSNVNYNVMFFSLPKKEDIIRLHNYLCFFAIPKSAPITEILKTLLPKTKPFCKFLVLQYEWNDNQFQIETYYDDIRDIANINIKIPRSNEYNNELMSILNIKNVPVENFNKGINDIIILPYENKLDESIINDIDSDSYVNEVYLKNAVIDDKLGVFNFYIDSKIGEGDSDIKKRLFLLAYLMLISNNSSSIGIPMKITLNGEQKLLGILWIVYDKKYSEIEKDEVPLIDVYFNNLFNPILNRINLALIDLMRLELDKQQLKTAIISILIDSYAHNISAHSLAALKWWFDLRQAEYDKRINLGRVSDPPVIKKLEYLLPQSCTNENLKEFATTSDNYYKILDLADSSNDENYTSLLEIVRFADDDLLSKLLCYAGYKNADDIAKYFRFPIPVDFALSNFIKFLRDKAAFWSGVTRDLQIGGEIKNLYEILWNDFASNPLYLGTIAYSEGIKKINISVELKNGNNQEYKKYEFAIIDMSVIEYESELFNSMNGIAQADLTEINYTSPEGIQNPIKYSKYALFYPGKDHYELKKKLEEHYNIFLPGGVVGEHALFTLFENTLRNIKHYYVNDDMKNKGLNFTIRIEPSKLMDDNLPLIGSKEHKLFKFYVYLNHNNSLFDFSLVNKKAQLIRVKDKLEIQTSKSVVDESGVPKLGGNSQDKICAAMLLNNQFISVEPSYIKDEETEERNKFYYNSDKNLYWIGFEDSLKENIVNSILNDYNNLRTEIIEELSKNAEEDKECGLTLNSKNEVRTTESFEKYKEKVLELINKEDYKGIFYKYFHLWKGDFIYAVTKKEQLKNENISRFKFVYVDKELYKDDDFKVYLTKKGVIRILTQDDVEKINDTYENFYNKLNYINPSIASSIADSIDKLFSKIKNSENLNYREKFYIYLAWLYKFIDNEKICFYLCAKNANAPKLVIHNYISSNPNCYDQDKKIYFRHGNETRDVDVDKILDYRSHGWLRENIFDEKLNLQSTDENQITKYPIFEEFVEILSTKICIIDNRLNKRIEETKKKKYKNLLNLDVYPELDVKNSLEDKEKWVSIKKNIAEKKYNFFIVHLSFIESLGFHENNITDFFNIELDFKKLIPEKFYTIITSGRGRSDWLEKLDNKYKQVVVFKPIESLLSGIENAVIFKDDFQLKYNLCKIIYGS